MRDTSASHNYRALAPLTTAPLQWECASWQARSGQFSNLPVLATLVWSCNALLYDSKESWAGAVASPSWTNVHKTSQFFKINHKQIHEWDRNFKSLLQQIFGKSMSDASWAMTLQFSATKWATLCSEVSERERSAGRAVSNRLLSKEAVRLARSLQLRNLVAFRHHIGRWKQRFGISMRQAPNKSQKDLKTT